MTQRGEGHGSLNERRVPLRDRSLRRSARRLDAVMVTLSERGRFDSSPALSADRMFFTDR